jgi:hypothetical protein
VKHIVSLGAGVQSSTMALMAACGEITPMPAAAIFADTQDEPQAVYTHLAWLRTVLPFPVIVGTAGKLSARLLDGYEGARQPFFLKNGSIQNRQCTREFKIRVIRREARKLITDDELRESRAAKKPALIQWIGISTDEADRMKDSGVRYVMNYWPLLEEGIRMSRADCIQWLRSHDYPIPPKSACKQCPFQPTERLVQLKTNSPAEWAELCAFDAALRTPQNIARFRGEVYVHRTRMPLTEIDFDALTRKDQGELFTNECEGMCGV